MTLTKYEQENIHQAGDVLNDMLPQVKLVRNYISQILSQQTKNDTGKDKLLSLWLSLYNDGGLSNIDDLLGQMASTIDTLSADLYSISEEQDGE